MRFNMSFDSMHTDKHVNTKSVANESLQSIEERTRELGLRQSYD